MYGSLFLKSNPVLSVRSSSDIRYSINEQPALSPSLAPPRVVSGHMSSNIQHNFDALESVKENIQSQSMHHEKVPIQARKPSTSEVTSYTGLNKSDSVKSSNTDFTNLEPDINIGEDNF